MTTVSALVGGLRSMASCANLRKGALLSGAYTVIIGLIHTLLHIYTFEKSAHVDADRLLYVDVGLTSLWIFAALVMCKGISSNRPGLAWPWILVTAAVIMFEPCFFGYFIGNKTTYLSDYDVILVLHFLMIIIMIPANAFALLCVVIYYLDKISPARKKGFTDDDVPSEVCFTEKQNLHEGSD